MPQQKKSHRKHTKEATNKRCGSTKKKVQKTWQTPKDGKKKTLKKKMGKQIRKSATTQKNMHSEKKTSFLKKKE